MEIKDIIKARRTELGFSMRDIAQRVGVSEATVSRLMGHSNIQTTMTYVTMDDSKIINDYKRHTA